MTNFQFRFLMLAMLFLSIHSMGKAQPFQAGNIDIQVGTSVLRNTGMHMPVDMRFQYGINDFLEAGVYFSYGLKIRKDWWYSFMDAELKNQYIHFLFPGACATVCITCLDGVEEKLKLPAGMDIYSTVFAGARLGVTKVPGDPFSPKWPLKRKFRPGLVLGGRYGIGDNFSLYLEAGYGPTGSLAGGLVYSLRP